MNLLKKKKILLIVTGGIACYKALDLIRRLQEAKVEVDCILTQNAKEFVNIITFESLLGKQICSNIFDLDQEKNMNHIKLAKECDAIIVVPCTANFVSKISTGTADDLATNVLLASTKLKIIAPAMNTNMWNNPAVKNNLKILKKMGIIIFNPQFGKLACNSKGSGKLMDIDLIVKKLNLIFSEKTLSGIKAIVTAGPSIEKIDPVRFLSNFSSGKQGYEIAEKLSLFGATTTLISGPTTLSPPQNVKFIQAKSGKDFLDMSLKSLPCDIFISVAAISDWKVNHISKNKIKKNKSELNIKFSHNVDILKTISTHKKRPKLVVGFSAETTNLIQNSKQKIEAKKCDWMLANKVNDKVGFNSENNKIFFINNENIKEWPLMKKSHVSLKLTKEIVSFFKNNKLIK